MRNNLIILATSIVGFVALLYFGGKEWTEVEEEFFPKNVKVATLLNPDKLEDVTPVNQEDFLNDIKSKKTQIYKAWGRTKNRFLYKNFYTVR